MKLSIERQKLKLDWNIRFTTGVIPRYPEFQLFPDPIASQREAWICSQLMKMKTQE